MQRKRILRCYTKDPKSKTPHNATDDTSAREVVSLNHKPKAKMKTKRNATELQTSVTASGLSTSHVQQRRASGNSLPSSSFTVAAACREKCNTRCSKRRKKGR